MRNLLKKIYENINGIEVILMDHNFNNIEEYIQIWMCNRNSHTVHVTEKKVKQKTHKRISGINEESPTTIQPSISRRN